jgi:hypothetical protein
VDFVGIPVASKSATATTKNKNKRRIDMIILLKRKFYTFWGTDSPLMAKLFPGILDMELYLYC